MPKRAFTLIELLVVMAIISLLVSFVLVSTNNAKAKARDANIQSLMHQVRNAAELNYVENNESYQNVCDETDNSLANSGEFGILETAIKKDNKNQNVTCFESADKKDFAASSPMVAQSGKHWCVESAGVGVEINNPITSAVCQ